MTQNCFRFKILLFLSSNVSMTICVGHLNGINPTLFFFHFRRNNPFISVVDTKHLRRAVKEMASLSESKEKVSLYNILVLKPYFDGKCDPNNSEALFYILL